MSRDDGFTRADTDTALFSDPKVARLWRRVRPDVARMAVAMTLYEATRLASWRTGDRVTAEDAAPEWMVDVAVPTADLIAAKLLAAGGRIPVRAWQKWFEPAAERRENSREYWREKKRRQRGEMATDHAVSPGDIGLVPRGHLSTGDKGLVPAASQPAEPTSRSEEASQPTRARGEGVADVYRRLYGGLPKTEKGRTFLDELQAKWGDDAGEALQAEYAVKGDPKTILGRTRDRLDRRRSQPKPPPPDPPPAEAAAAIDGLRRQFGMSSTRELLNGEDR